MIMFLFQNQTPVADSVMEVETIILLRMIHPKMGKKCIRPSPSSTMLVIRVPCCVALTNLARHQRDRQISPGGIQKKSVTPLHSSTTQQWYRERHKCVATNYPTGDTRKKSIFLLHTTLLKQHLVVIGHVVYLISFFI